MSIYLIPFVSFDHLSIFEIYPESEIPLLTEIAKLDWFSSEEDPIHLLPDILIFRVFHVDRIVFRVVNYRTSYSTWFSADVDVKINSKYDVEVFFVLSKTLILASNFLLDRYSQQRQLLSSYVKKEYQSGPSHPCCLTRQTTFATTTFSITIPPIYRQSATGHSSEFHSRMILHVMRFLVV